MMVPITDPDARPEYVEMTTEQEDRVKSRIMDVLKEENVSYLGAICMLNVMEREIGRLGAHMEKRVTIAELLQAKD